jgi:hypothetical protein
MVQQPVQQYRGFSAAVDFFGLDPAVDRERIGLVALRASPTPWPGCTSTTTARPGGSTSGPRIRTAPGRPRPRWPSTISRLLTHIDEISPRPVLIIAEDKAHSRYFSEDAHEAAAQPKELLNIKDANHVDLHDRSEKIPFERISGFFDKHLK